VSIIRAQKLHFHLRLLTAAFDFSLVMNIPHNVILGALFANDVLRAEKSADKSSIIYLRRFEKYEVKDSHRQMLLLWAAENGYEAIFKMLLADYRVDVNAKGFHGRTPLSRAAENGHEAIVKKLLAGYRVDVNAKDSHGRTPLSRAAENGHEAVVEKLLADYGVDVNAKGFHGRTPLLWAAENGHEAVVEKLLADYRVDVNAKDSHGRTPLSRAAENGHEVVVRLLLADYRVDMNAEDWNGRTPLWWAAENGHEAVAKLLFRPGPNDAPPETPIYLRMVWHIIWFLMVLARRLQTALHVDLSFDRLSEFPNRLRPPCTTMPWNARPALVVLWGVCWMFYSRQTTPQPDQSYVTQYSELPDIGPGKSSHGNSFRGPFVFEA
jgi:ankyrin repeat protein